MATVSRSNKISTRQVPHSQGSQGKNLAKTEKVKKPEVIAHENALKELWDKSRRNAAAGKTKNDLNWSKDWTSDKKALEVMALQGRIIAVKTGTTVTIEDRDIWNTTESFRVQGNPDTRYASIGQVR